MLGQHPVGPVCAVCFVRGVHEHLVALLADDENGLPANGTQERAENIEQTKGKSAKRDYARTRGRIVPFSSGKDDMGPQALRKKIGNSVFFPPFFFLLVNIEDFGGMIRGPRHGIHYLVEVEGETFVVAIG